MRLWGSISVLVAVLALGGCGDGRDDSTPVACLEGKAAYEHALDNEPVLLRGETPISSCLAENQSGGDLATVGTALIAVATELNSEAREAADAAAGGAGIARANLAARQLGYLVGATRRGAAETEGIHADLIRRLEAAARYSPGGEPLPPAFERPYRTGLETGEA